MARPAIPSWTAARTAVSLAAVLLATACSTSPAPTPSNTSSAPVTPARLTRTLPDDPARMLFPATGAETRWTQGLDVFGQQVARTVTASCARDDGTGLSEQVPLAFIPFAEIPDLDFIARHGFGQSAEVPAPAASPGPTRSGNPATVRRCRAEGTEAADVVRDAYAPLQGRWFRELASLRRDPVTARTLNALPTCLAGYGFHVNDENGFFALVDSRLVSAAPTEFPYINRELGRVYAACMRPVEAVREPARLRLRAQFLTDHAHEIRRLRETLAPSLHRAAKEHGIRIAFPAP